RAARRTHRPSARKAGHWASRRNARGAAALEVAPRAPGRTHLLGRSLPHSGRTRSARSDSVDLRAARRLGDRHAREEDGGHERGFYDVYRIPDLARSRGVFACSARSSGARSMAPTNDATQLSTAVSADPVSSKVMQSFGFLFSSFSKQPFAGSMPP